MAHKTWKPQEEKELVSAFKQSGGSPTVIPQLAKRFDRSPDAIARKLGRLGLNVAAAKIELTATFDAVKDLPSPEQVLKIVAGALQKATEPGLGKTELQRLSTIVDLSKEYREGLKEYVNYKAIEAKLAELDMKYAELAKEKTKDPASKRNSAQVVQASAK
jgi:hypothetical protein